MNNQISELSIGQLDTVSGGGIDDVEMKPKAHTPFADLMKIRNPASDTPTTTTTTTPIAPVTVTFGK